jgi:DNA-binding beta-propeller fold protein YncE
LARAARPRYYSLMKEIRFLKEAELWGRLGVLLGSVVVVGCATRPPAKPECIVFPMPPDEPRIQYLAGFASETDLSRPSSFAKFIFGGTQGSFKPIWKPYGATTTQGKILVCDTQLGSLATVDLLKKKISYLRPAGLGTIGLPLNVAVDSEGTKYITDSKREQVLIFDKENHYVDALGKKGETKPRGVAVEGNRLYVSDVSNHCVRVYGLPDRKLLLTVPRDPADEKSRLYSPTNVAVDREGRIYVADTGGFAVHVFDAEGNHIRRVGEQGAEAGRFAMPKGVGVDREGRIYVVDAAAALVQLFDNEGRLLMYFGYPQTSGPAGLYLPAGLAIDYENAGLFKDLAAPGYAIDYLIVVVSQVGPRKISVFGFLRKL